LTPSQQSSLSGTRTASACQDATADACGGQGLRGVAPPLVARILGARRIHSDQADRLTFAVDKVVARHGDRKGRARLRCARAEHDDRTHCDRRNNDRQERRRNFVDRRPRRAKGRLTRMSRSPGAPDQLFDCASAPRAVRAVRSVSRQRHSAHMWPTIRAGIVGDCCHATDDRSR